MPKFKEIKDFDLRLAKFIMRNHPHGFVGAIIEGERGYGKSMYALKLMAQIYYHYDGLSEEEAWQKSLDNMLFTMEDFTSRIDWNINNDYITPVWCLDDATVHFGSLRFFTALYEVMQVYSLVATIRTACTGLLITCPRRSLLLKGLREYDDFTVQIAKDREPKDRIARGIKWFTIPDGRRRYRKMYEDHYSCMVPNWIYNKYEVKRKKYLKDVNTEMMQIIEKNMQKKMKKGGVESVKIRTSKDRNL